MYGCDRLLVFRDQVGYETLAVCKNMNDRNECLECFLSTVAGKAIEDISTLVFDKNNCIEQQSEIRFLEKMQFEGEKVIES